MTVSARLPGWLKLAIAFGAATPAFAQSTTNETATAGASGTPPAEAQPEIVDDAAPKSAEDVERYDRGIAAVEAAILRMDSAEPGDRVPSRARFATLPGLDTVQSRERPEYDPVGKRAGGLTLYPQVTAAGYLDLNVFRSSDNARSDVALAPEAKLAGVTNWSRHEIAFDLSVQNRTYARFSSEDATTGRAFATARIDIQGRSRIDLEGELSHGIS